MSDNNRHVNTVIDGPDSNTSSSHTPPCPVGLSGPGWLALVWLSGPSCDCVLCLSV